MKKEDGKEKLLTTATEEGRWNATNDRPLPGNLLRPGNGKRNMKGVCFSCGECTGVFGMVQQIFSGKRIQRGTNGVYGRESLVGEL